jgi:hypothetical protein
VSKLSLEWLAGSGIEMQSPFPASIGGRLEGCEGHGAADSLPLRVCAHFKLDSTSAFPRSSTPKNKITML